ncbi:unnamed protein product [Caenorhabditis bovis]|uniref:Uncharacterized protein n=1 Tax=Caenorhabditis bovis TaxID=2654633 RepID=A0A8S1F0E0_9PELO|nr:unnamed protein product [Caenorhabditis bovis]
MRLLVLCSILGEIARACLPTLSQPKCGCSSCPCPGGGSYSSYAPPAPLPPAPLPPLPSYHGQYLDAPVANPAFQGTVPLSFSNDYPSYSGGGAPPASSASSQEPPSILNPLQYLEHVHVSHTPASYPSPQPHQIEVEPSSAIIAEDPYASDKPAAASEPNGNIKLVTYYNQYCAGEKMAVGTKETMGSATKKCEMLKCVAANVVTDSDGTYTVSYLKTAKSRSNRKGNYCLSSKELPVKGKRVIRKFDEMLASEEAERVRRLLKSKRL